MQRSCTQCSAQFEITDDDFAFYEKVSPIFNGKKELIPPPTLCPQCRLQRRMSFINHIYVYMRPSSITGKRIFSMFPETASFPVYEHDQWWSDAWDATEYGQDFNPTEGFFGQYDQLQRQVPHFSLMALKNENCDFCNNISENKNCYLCFNTRRSENCFCCERAVGSTNCLECTDVGSCELCNECVACNQCYNLRESEDCVDCSDSAFLLNCRSCRSCFCCTNLRHAEYCIFNEQKTKEEYEAFMQNLALDHFSMREEWRVRALEFWKTQPRPHAIMNMTEGASGNYVFQSKNAYDCYLVRNVEDVRYCAFGFDGVKDAYDFTAYGDQVEQVYEIARCGNRFSRSAFCYYCYDGCSDLFYCSFCVACQNCFGCNGLRKKRYCIFNKQYTKEEYERLVPAIIEHMRREGSWGEFFPIQLSPFPYNHTHAGRYFPVTRDQAAAMNVQWLDEAITESAQAIDPSLLPDTVPVTNEAIVTRSTQSGKAFKITGDEIRQCRAHAAPLPRTTYNERMEDRAKRLGGLFLYERTCAKTGKPILTTYPPDSPWTIWDRDVYEQEFGG